MFEVFLLTLRELAALLLIVNALKSYLHHYGRAELNTHVISGTLASMALGVTPTLVLVAVAAPVKGVGALLSSYATVDSSAAWVSFLTPFLERGEWHGWACLGLMLFPTTLMARQWWFEAEAAR